MLRLVIAIQLVSNVALLAALLWRRRPEPAGSVLVDAPRAADDDIRPEPAAPRPAMSPAERELALALEQFAHAAEDVPSDAPERAAVAPRRRRVPGQVEVSVLRALS
jgi:hypothetical protein